MSPRLRAEQIPVMAVQRAKVETLHAGEVRLTCDLCDWSTIRPERYAESARLAHAIQREKGMLPGSSGLSDVEGRRDE